jgi:hypothetical protein
MGNVGSAGIVVLFVGEGNGGGMDPAAKVTASALALLAALGFPSATPRTWLQFG